MKKVLVAIALIASLAAASAQHSMDVVLIKSSDGLTWKDNPNIPKGAQVAVLQEPSPTNGNVSIQRVKFPANYKVPPHTHPSAETITVISGRIGLGSGEKFEAKATDMVTASAFYSHPANHPHYVWTENEEAIIQVQSVGQRGITYINPADDPRKK
jgi:quercetin dioxygenase-like cupin family protein